MWGGSGDAKDSVGLLPGRETIGPLLLMAVTPVFIFVLWHIMFHCNGDMVLFYSTVTADGFQWYGAPNSLFPSPFDPLAWKIIGVYMAVELLFMKAMPGAKFEATMTAKGNTPVYKANGMQSFLGSLALLLGLAYYGVINPAVVYDKFGELLMSMNVFALLFCAMLLVKGYLAPSSTDSGSTGNMIIDFYWGTELYPRVFGWDVKTFTNCRFGMMFWALGILCFAFKQYEDLGHISSSMFVCVALQLIYITKFFWWETGYWCSMDIQHDRAGYYICWGCLVWLPCVYTSQTFYLVKHPVQLGTVGTILNLVAGFLAIWINYDADRQRQFFRKCNGECTIWGSAPRMIIAKYTSKGEERMSLLLASGWWGLSRHFHYIPEILASLFWTVPSVGITENQVIPYFYVVYLTILLFDRAWRDDERCRSKYGRYWEQYCDIVPKKVIPGVI
uniref:7-dehydrocholesterol reductase n=1 Tax=Rhizochromulina marina TaxID=1034831 RepID=A0A7S2RJ36_9STRA|mmetsp:Transcript_17115/g.49829  ORF Transcript_17115/g.49829 Transcript_17115/m.49829 type:complete len:446 (+) Transcript_17115:38-1375(+)